MMMMTGLNEIMRHLVVLFRISLTHHGLINKLLSGIQHEPPLIISKRKRKREKDTSRVSSPFVIAKKES